MRRSSVFGALIAANFMTAGLGNSITGEGGKLAVSNLLPLVFVAVAGIARMVRSPALDRRFLWFFLIFNLTCTASFVIFLLRFEWQPNFLVLLFQDTQILFCVLLWSYAEEHPLEFRSAVKAGILLFIPVSIVYGAYEVLRGDPWVSFGMDDKSQSAVLLCCAAYVIVRFFPGGVYRLIGAALYVGSYLTISRLPVFFLPAILLVLMRRSRYAAVLTLLGSGAVVYVLVTYGDTIKDVFTVYNRLSSVQEITQTGSTTAHLLLLKTGLQMKFSDFWIFFFGIGPGNFSKALTSFATSIEQIEALDPHFITVAREGNAPLHSMPLQLLLDYNLAFFFVFAFFIFRAFQFLLRQGHLVDLVFFLSLLLASSFYSVHNKAYFFLYVVTIALLLRHEPRQVRVPAASSAQGVALAPP